MPSSDSVLLYVHIPKAAGTTLASLLYEQCRSPEEYRAEDGLLCSGVFYHPAGFIREIDPKSHSLVDDVLKREDLRAVLGHFSFGLHEQLTRPYRYVTVLREPVSRLSSLYHFHRLNESKYGHLNQIRLGETMDLSHFVANPPYAEIDNGMTRRISGQWPAIGQCDRSMLERAISNLRKSFAVVGVSERFDETIVLMSEVFGWPEPPLSYPKNVNTERPAEESDPKIQALIQDQNGLDVELYQMAVELFDEQITRLGDSFFEKLENYQGRKKTWYEKHQIS